MQPDLLTDVMSKCLMYVVFNAHSEQTTDTVFVVTVISVYLFIIHFIISFHSTCGMLDCWKFLIGSVQILIIFFIMPIV